MHELIIMVINYNFLQLSLRTFAVQNINAKIMLKLRVRIILLSLFCVSHQVKIAYLHLQKETKNEISDKENRITKFKTSRYFLIMKK